MSKWQNFSKGLIRENAVFVLLLGMCPTLGVTTSTINGLGMGLATTFVLLSSNITVSLIKSFIPDKVRIPSFIVIIASFVTIVDLLMAGFFQELHEQLGLFIPLIVVNCLILGRAEAFASKNSLLDSIIDALGMGVGFSMALSMLGAIREILGAGKILGFAIIPEGTDGIILFILAPGAFIALAYLSSAMNYLKNKAGGTN